MTNNNIKKTDWGFTLIELLIVITIIGLLASIILVGLGRVRVLGRDARRLADLSQVRSGLEVYFTRYSTYPMNPGSGDGGSAYTSMTTSMTTGAGAVTNSLPKDPISGGVYVYGYSASAATYPALGYVLRAVLEDPYNPQLRDSIAGNGAGSPTYGLDCGTTQSAPPWKGATTPYYCIGVQP